MSILWLLLSLLLSSHLLLLSSADSITLSLSRVPLPSTNHPSENLKYHVAASLARAHHLIKCPNHDINAPLYPRSYGEYSVNLSFGMPQQALGFIMDTGSSLVWSPCTNHYTCTHCNVSGVDPAHIPTFIPESSSSYNNVTCQSPQCKWLFPDQDLHCNNSHTQCRYLQPYGEGETTGWLISETLTFPWLSVHNFIVGCSVSTTYMPEGIAGFGRARMSLPAQLGLTSFSYCLVSHEFDDNTTASSDLVLTRGGGNGPAANYTPFISNSAYVDHYYVSLQSISIGGVHVNVPAKFLVPDAKGNGGTVVDSGTTLTMLEQSVFDLVFNETVKQVGKKYTRAKNVENETDLKPCYKVGKNKLIKDLPQLAFHFQGNTEMVLPLENYFSYATESVVCTTIANYEEVEGGPAIILGNYLQQDFYMEYDLENNRLGIRQQKCK